MHYQIDMLVQISCCALLPQVAQLAGYIGEHSAYHHGEASLHGAIIGMAQTFCGSNK
jgi:hypothetical protein